jgi:hypothetical protein
MAVNELINSHVYEMRRLRLGCRKSRPEQVLKGMFPPPVCVRIGQGSCVSAERLLHRARSWTHTF